jgi:hypothetical protein
VGLVEQPGRVPRPGRLHRLPGAGARHRGGTALPGGETRRPAPAAARRRRPSSALA